MTSRSSRMTAAFIIGPVARRGETFCSRKTARAAAAAPGTRRILWDLIFRQKGAASSADLIRVQTQLFTPPSSPSSSPDLRGPLTLPVSASASAPPSCPAPPLALRIGYDVVFDLPGTETTLLFMLYAHPEVA